MWDESLVLTGRSFRSRLIVGAGKYPSPETMRRCYQAAGAEMVVVPVRGLDLSRAGESLLDVIDLSRITLLPSTSGASTADEAVRMAYLAREAGLGDFVKVEVAGDPAPGFPDTQALVEAVKTLSREGFIVLASSSGDPVAARRLEEAGAAAVLVLGAAPGSGLGVVDPHGLRIVLDRATVPVIVEDGIGTASDAAIAMEVGCHGVLVGPAIAEARDPEGMAEAMKLAVEAGRYAYKAGRIPRKVW